MLTSKEIKRQEVGLGPILLADMASKKGALAGKSQAGLPGLLISSSLHREEDNQGWKELRNQQPAGWVWPLL
jgi:hypothetical protein